jgi:hypothetical protein
MNILQTLGRRELQTVVCHNDHPTDYLQSGTIALKFPNGPCYATCSHRCQNPIMVTDHLDTGMDTSACMKLAELNLSLDFCQWMHVPRPSNIRRLSNKAIST